MCPGHSNPLSDETLLPIGRRIVNRDTFAGLDLLDILQDRRCEGAS